MHYLGAFAYDLRIISKCLLDYFQVVCWIIWNYLLDYLRLFEDFLRIFGGFFEIICCIIWDYLRLSVWLLEISYKLFACYLRLFVAYLRSFEIICRLLGNPEVGIICWIIWAYLSVICVLFEIICWIIWECGFLPDIWDYLLIYLKFIWAYFLDYLGLFADYLLNYSSLFEAYLNSILRGSTNSLLDPGGCAALMHFTQLSRSMIIISKLFYFICYGCELI